MDGIEKCLSGYCSLKDLGIVWIILKNLPYIFFIFVCECVNVKTNIYGKILNSSCQIHYSVPTQFLNSKSFTHALALQRNFVSIYVFTVSEKELSGLSPIFHIRVSVSAYIPTIGPPFFPAAEYSRQRPIVVIYVLTET